jgi:hypothetical protein
MGLRHVMGGLHGLLNTQQLRDFPQEPERRNRFVKQDVNKRELLKFEIVCANGNSRIRISTFRLLNDPDPVTYAVQQKQIVMVRSEQMKGIESVSRRGHAVTRSPQGTFSCL